LAASQKKLVKDQRHTHMRGTKFYAHLSDHKNAPWSSLKCPASPAKNKDNAQQRWGKILRKPCRRRPFFSQCFSIRKLWPGNLMRLAKSIWWSKIRKC